MVLIPPIRPLTLWTPAAPVLHFSADFSDLPMLSFGLCKSFLELETMTDDERPYSNWQIPHTSLASGRNTKSAWYVMVNIPDILPTKLTVCTTTPLKYCMYSLYVLGNKSTAPAQFLSPITYLRRVNFAMCRMCHEI